MAVPPVAIQLSFSETIDHMALLALVLVLNKLQEDPYVAQRSTQRIDYAGMFRHLDSRREMWPVCNAGTVLGVMLLLVRILRERKLLAGMWQVLVCCAC